MSSLVPFERYDEEFDSLTQQVEQSLTKLKELPEKEDNNQTEESSSLRFTTGLLAQCDDLLKQMAVEARGVDDASLKRDLLHKVRICKTKLANLRDDVKTIQSDLDRKSLLRSNSLSKNGKQGNSDSRQRLLETTAHMSAQNDTLDHARRVMAETEDVALEITSELSRNRETIESAHGRVRNVSGLTNRARRILQNMSRRQVQQRLAVYVVSAFLVIFILVILFNLR
jgi:vesicle transport through interaction with t-SNAREs protein 1